MNGKRIIVTGASGFIAKHALAPLLAQGFEVHAVSRQPLDCMAGIHWHQANLLDHCQHLPLLEKTRATHLLHAAWYAEHGKFWHALENHQWLDASKHLVSEFVKQGGHRILGVGSCAEYDWCREDSQPWREDDSCMPTTLYGQSKHALHQYIAEIADAGVSYSWARIFMTFGPGEPPGKLIPSIIIALLKGRAAKCSSGVQVRDYSDARDIGKCLALLIDTGQTGPINLASGQASRIADIASMLATIIGRGDLLSLGALPDRDGEPPCMVADISLLKSAISFQFPSLQQRLEETIDWWKTNLQPGNASLSATHGTA